MTMLLLALSSASATAKTKIVEDDILTTLNTRYQNTTADCDGKPAFYCSGVLLSADETWKDGDNSLNNAVSFSYLRHDISTTTLYGGEGYIFKDQSTAIEEGSEIDAYCAYNADAATDSHPDSTLGPGCGTTVADGTFFNSCADAGVTTVEGYSEYYNKYVSADGGYRWDYQCSFDMNDANSFYLSVQTHEALPDGVRSTYNELEFKPWYWKDGVKLPIEAFFYLKVTDETQTEINLQKAKNERADYFNKTGLNVPVVEIDFSSFDAPFVSAE